eukprot:TRINITY_DN98267_c0_g1_i1.p1 TRINITY_DN98267_c0_g1~~TRINITY_DN98267_c0_g1_i1.p1  ORF type:complete len:183 (-),score=12.75 TRINITY_DN98267_c0_g1_i1:340-888(-)
MVVQICFVCTGNTCRSFMAEYVTKALLAHDLDFTCANQEVIVCSRGTDLRENKPHPTAIEALARANINIPEEQLYQHVPKDIRSDLPQVVTDGPGDAKTYYFCMARRHIESVTHILTSRISPRQDNSDTFGDEAVFLLKDDKDDIPDPYNGPLEDYIDCLEVIQSSCKPILRNLVQGKDPFD